MRQMDDNQIKYLGFLLGQRKYDYERLCSSQIEGVELGLSDIL